DADLGIGERAARHFGDVEAEAGGGTDGARGALPGQRADHLPQPVRCGSSVGIEEDDDFVGGGGGGDGGELVVDLLAALGGDAGDDGLGVGARLGREARQQRHDGIVGGLDGEEQTDGGVVL